MKALRKIIRALDVATDYVFAVAVVVVMWLLGLGLKCARVEMQGGADVRLHGLSCSCGGTDGFQK